MSDNGTSVAGVSLAQHPEDKFLAATRDIGEKIVWESNGYICNALHHSFWRRAFPFRSEWKEEEDKIWLSNFDSMESMPISWNTYISHFQISLDFCGRWAKNCVGISLPYGVLRKPIDPCFYCCHGSMGFPKTPYRRLFPTKFFERSLVAKIKRNLKMTIFQELGIDSKLLNQI